MMKRFFDATLAAAGLILSSPLWIVIPTAIKLEDGGPIFFPQERRWTNCRSSSTSCAAT